MCIAIYGMKIYVPDKWRCQSIAPMRGCLFALAALTTRQASALEIIRSFLRGTPWSIATVKAAGAASAGRRQAMAFAAQQAKAKTEFDV